MKKKLKDFLHLISLRKKVIEWYNTEPIGGEDLKILDIMNSLEKPRIFQTMNDIENFEIFTTNGFSIGITQSPFLRGNFDDIVDFMLRFDRPRSIEYSACILLMSRIVIAHVEYWK